MDKIIDNQIVYGNISIKSYNVNYDVNNAIMATESTYVEPIVSTQSSSDDMFNLLNYISALYSVTIKGVSIYGYSVPNVIEYNEDYLVVVEDFYRTIKKRIFDLKNIELPDRAKQEILEIQDYLKNAEKNLSTRKFVPLIHGIVDNKTIPLIKKEDENYLKSFYEKIVDSSYERRYLKDRNKLSYIGGYGYLSFWLVFYILSFNKNIVNFCNEHIITSTAGFIGLYVGLNKLFNKMGEKTIYKSIDNDFKDYLELCNKIANGDREAIRSLTEEIGRVSAYNNSNNSEFYLSLVRDLAILDCFKDKSLTPIKIELISLGCEYVEYRSLSSEKQMIEELFMKKLKAIEKKR